MELRKSGADFAAFCRCDLFFFFFFFFFSFDWFECDFFGLAGWLVDCCAFGRFGTVCGGRWVGFLSQWWFWCVIVFWCGVWVHLGGGGDGEMVCDRVRVFVMMKMMMMMME